MIIIFGQTLIYWSGMLAAISLVFTFLGCCCNIRWNLCQYKLVSWLAKYHQIFVYSSIILALVHVTLALLAKNLGVYV